VAGDPCPSCGTPLRLTEGIEVGHIFKLGTKYSEKLGARFPGQETARERAPLSMGW